MVRADDGLKKSVENPAGNDYCSLESDRGNPDDTVIYYPTSDSSNKDYTSLIDDANTGNYCGLNHRDNPVHGHIPTPSKQGGSDNVKFQVNGLNGFGVSKLVEPQAKTGQWSLGNIAEEQFGTTRSNDLDLFKSLSATRLRENSETDATGAETKLTFDQSSENLNAKANGVTDFHDYELCNGSVHEYYVLEAEVSTSL